MKRIFMILLILLLAGCMKGNNKMAVEFNGNNYIDFGSVVSNQTVRTVADWVYLDNMSSKINYIMYHTGGGWYFSTVENQLAFVQGFSTSNPT